MMFKDFLKLEEDAVSASDLQALNPEKFVEKIILYAVSESNHDGQKTKEYLMEIKQKLEHYISNPQAAIELSKKINHDDWEDTSA